MRRVSLYGIVAALLPVAALAQVIDQGFEPETGFAYDRGAFGTRKSSAVLSLPLTTNGSPFADSAQTVSHLTWDGRHNLILYSEQINQAAWSKLNGGTGAAPVVTADQYANPVDGAVTAEEVYFDKGAGSTVNDYSILDGISTSASYVGRKAASAVWLRTVDGSTVTMQLGQYASDYYTVTVTPTWTRFEAGSAVATNTVGVRLMLRGTFSTSQTARVAVWGGQGNIDTSTPTAYVATTTAAKLSVPQESISGVTWTGDTVPAVASTSSPFSPGKAGAGVFGAAVYYSGGTSVGEFGSSDWSASVVFSQASAGVAQVLVGKMADAGVNGWYVRLDAAGTASYRIHDGSIRTAATTNTAVPGVNVVTVGRSGASCFIRLNGGSNATSACGTLTSSASEQIRVGGHGSSASALLPATTTTIYEVIASTEPYSDALHLQRWQASTGLDRGPVSVTRAESQSYTQNGTLWQAAPATLAVTSTGSEVWKAATQLYPTPSAPAAGTVTATVTGNHTFSVIGTGSQQISAGTATTTGLPCTATEASPCVFGVTVTGTLTLAAVTGSLTYGQVEAGGYRTPQILTFPSTRSATVATVPLPSLGNRWCVSVTATPGSGRAWGSAVNQAILWGGGPSTAADSWSFIQSAANIRFRVYDSTATVKYSGGALPSAGAHRLTGCNNSGTLTLCQDGVSVGATVGAGTGLHATSPTTLRLGWDGNGADATFWDGTLSNLKVCRGATKCSDCR